MGFFGGGSSSGEKKPSENPEQLNTEDLRSGARSVFDSEHGYKRITRWYSRIAGVGGEGTQWERTLRAAVDYAGTNDSKVNEKDFEVMHKRIDTWLEKKEPSLDKHLPFMGQLAFGTAVGFAGARGIKMAWRHKFKFAAAGFMLYNVNEIMGSPQTPEQLAAKHQYEALINAKESWLKQYNLTTPGQADIALFLDNVGLGVINRKLGPGGLSEGPSGTGSVLLGLWWGLRVI
eukprot:TRINITY_DN76377_c0_g1_i1.p2 TRINITY_DN76377_c0_g1~~TRINITY_DN76377_c0_g1_i1.p2  ORF type:complete len:250 (+),score=106.42 TRINITY_DN76377_c0_g1_i1:56-751(+)